MAFSVPYYEMDGFPRPTYDKGHFYALRRVWVAWADRVTFLNELGEQTGINAGYPYPDGPFDAYVRRAEIVPYGAQTNADGAPMSQYEWCYINLWHSTNGPTWHNNAWLEETLQPTAENLQLPHWHFKWAAEPTDPPAATIDVTDADAKQLTAQESPRKMLGSYRYAVTAHRVPPPLPPWVKARPGLVNINEFATALLGIVFDKDTLRYDGAHVSRLYQLGKLPYYDITAVFTFRPMGWNLHWNSQREAWEPIYRILTGDRAYIYEQVVYDP